MRYRLTTFAIIGAFLFASCGEVSDIVRERLEHPADTCAEDEAWIATHHNDPEGVETFGSTVTRKCVPIDNLSEHLGR